MGGQNAEWNAVLRKFGGVKAAANSRASATVDLRFYRGDKRYEISNHLGNVLVVVSDRKLWVSSSTVNFDHYLADLYSVQDYDPFGMTIPERSWSAPEEEGYRFGFNGQEKSREINGTESSFTAEFWEYDARIVRRWNPDPRPNASMSDYTVFRCNPLMFTDIHGDSAVVFGPDGAYVNRIDDGKGKDVWSIIHFAIKNEDGTFSNPTVYLFSDPVNDIKEIRNGTIKKLVFVSENRVSRMLGLAGAFEDRDFIDSYLYFYNESLGASENNTRGESNLDFSYTFIPSFFEKEGASQQPNPEKKSTYKPSPNLYIPQGTYMAFNHMNFGNFLWGAAGNAMNFGLLTLSTGAHVNSIVNFRDNGYDSQLDSDDDQLSIIYGWHYANDRNYSERTWSRSTGWHWVT